MAESSETNSLNLNTENAEKKPKSILKHTDDHPHKVELKWDEMNILETFHPANKDYGHMKINEPPTPYALEIASDDEGAGGGESSALDTNKLMKNLETAEPREDYTSDNENEVEHEDEHSSEHKQEFVEHRKKHYDEFSQVKLARELIEKELAELEDDEDSKMDVP